MKLDLNRRSFLGQAALALTGLASVPLIAPGGWAGQRKLLFMISLAEWSLHRTLSENKMDHLDFPKVAKQDYGIEAIELVNQFFADKAKDRTYLAEQLLASLDESDLEQQWTAEAKRRRDEVRSGRVKPISAEAVYRRIDRLLGK